MILQDARNVLRTEAEAILGLARRIDKNFKKAVEVISRCKGRIVVTGIGKSGIIGRKISSTFSSAGTPAFYLHPAEGLHGDIGMLMKGDIVLAISYSGETEEMAKVLPLIKKMGLVLITMTGNKGSNLARNSDIVLDISVKKEACPYNLMPTSSSTAAMALGDALAVALIAEKGIKKENLAMFHPGGAIGKRLLLVRDIMRHGKENPLIKEHKTVKDALFVMTSTRLGAVSVVDKRGRMCGFFTDGDLRRNLQKKGERVLNERISALMTKNPTTISPDEFAVGALRLMQERMFDNIPVVDRKRRPVGIIDERDLLLKGINKIE